MSIRSSLLLPIAFTLFSVVSSARAVTVQDLEDVLPDGSAFLFVEGEDAELALPDGSRGDPATGWLIVDKDNPIKTIDEVGDPPDPVIKGGLDVLPADTNASRGGALFHQLGAGGASTATWEVQFAIPATYYVYLHFSMYNRDTNTNYGNEDSIYLPPWFNTNSRSDWIGFEGVDIDGNPDTGNSNRDGWMPLSKDVVSAGFVETFNTTDLDFWDGQFHWMFAEVAVDSDENDAYVDDFGQAIQYEVTQADVGAVLDYQISNREAYSVIDGLLFSTSNLLLEDFTQEEMDEFFLDLGGAPELQAGDADQDLDFDQLDLVQVQVAAKYLTGQAATWGEGDWNGAPGGAPGNPPAGNGRFDQLDIVAAQQAGRYLTGPYAQSTVAVLNAVAPDGEQNDGQTSVGYHASTGEVWVDAPAGVELTSINIDSASGIFTGDPAQNLGGSFDNDADNNIFKATFGSSFGSMSFGNVAAPGLSESFVLGDLTVVGSLNGGGDLGNVDLIYVPEPSSTLLLVLGLLAGLLRCRSRRV